MIFGAVVVIVVIIVIVVILVVVVSVIIIVVMEDYGLEVLAKTPGLYQVPKLRKLNFDFFEKLWIRVPYTSCFVAANNGLWKTTYNLPLTIFDIV